MNEANQKRSLSMEDKQRLISFIEILMQIDKREYITPTAKSIREKRVLYGA